MLPKRKCPVCNAKSIKFISMIKNLFITNEGSLCQNCNSLILVDHKYKIFWGVIFTFARFITFIFSIYLLMLFIKSSQSEHMVNSELMIFMNLIILFMPTFLLIIIECYIMPLVFASEKEIKKRNVLGIIYYLSIFTIPLVILGFIYYS